MYCIEMLGSFEVYMESERHRRWMKASNALGAIELFTVPIVRGLGKLDAKLIAEEKRFSELPSELQETSHEQEALNECYVLSFLWVLGAYEMIRTLDQRCQDYPWLVDEPLVASRIKSIKRSFERLRVPLAKMEQARRYKDTDYPIAYPTSCTELGTSWHVSDTLVISRRELSDKFLDLIEDMASSAERHAG